MEPSIRSRAPLRKWVRIATIVSCIVTSMLGATIAFFGLFAIPYVGPFLLVTGLALLSAALLLACWRTRLSAFIAVGVPGALVAFALDALRDELNDEAWDYDEFDVRLFAVIAVIAGVGALTALPAAIFGRGRQQPQR